MRFLNCWVLLTLFCGAFCLEDEIKVEDQFDDDISDSREGKQLRKHIEHEGWRAVDSRNRQDSGEWIPKDTLPFNSDNPETIPRRRRIRKRKRRPPQLISEDSQEYLPRRRRVRPHTLEEASDQWSIIEEEPLRRPYSRRRTTPVYTPEIQSEEHVEVQQPLSAVLQFDEDKTETPQKPSRVYEKVRDPFTALEEADAKARLKKKQQEVEQETTTVSHLKALLKQSGGSLSLSELLQQKNLSLEDLLNGKEQALSALTEKVEIATEDKRLEGFTEPPKTEPEITVYNKNTNRNYETFGDSSEVTTETKEHLDAQRNRLALLHNHDGVKLFTSKNYEVITEPTTERRIFVPSRHSSLTNKPTTINTTPEAKSVGTEKVETTQMPPMLSTRKHILGNKYLDYRSKYVSLKPKLKTLPLTSAKLNLLTNKRPSALESTEASATIAAPLPSNAFKINVQDLFSIAQETTTPNQDGPVKITFDIEKMVEKELDTIKVTTDTETISDHVENITDTDGPVKMTFDIQKMLEDAANPKNNLKSLDSSENEVTTEIKSSTPAFNYEKIKPTSAREEIMEILKDQRDRHNLSRILELRNMTIEELVAQRERGSSQLHLADIFHNQTREPEPPNEPFIGHIRSLPYHFFDRKPKTLPDLAEEKKELDDSNYFASAVDIKPLQLNYGDKEEGLKEAAPITKVPVYTVTSFPTYKIEMEKITKNNQQPPFHVSLWKNLYPDIYGGSLENPNEELDALKSTKVEEIVQNDIRRVEDVENTISEAVNGQLNIELNENNYEDVADYVLPRGVKSTIIASAAIIGISVLVFLVVFIIFKWLQKQRERLRYSSSFSCSRIKSPILEARPRRTIRTIMSETLGRKKKYSNVYPQSMSDYIWESDKKPFQ